MANTDVDNWLGDFIESALFFLSYSVAYTEYIVIFRYFISSMTLGQESPAVETPRGFSHVRTNSIPLQNDSPCFFIHHIDDCAEYFPRLPMYMNAVKIV